MPNPPTTECAHFYYGEWLRKYHEWFSESETVSDRTLRESVRKARISQWHDWGLPSHKGFKAVVSTSIHQRYKRQVKGLIVYTNGICGPASEVLLESRERLRKELGLVVARSKDTALNAQHILRDLDATLNEQDEPDFLHRPTQYAYDTARQIIENTYTHYVGSAPSATIAPDGQGGIIAEWKSGRRIVRLIVSSSQDGKSYVYSRGATRSQIDYSASGLTLSQQLCFIFPD